MQNGANPTDLMTEGHQAARNAEGSLVGMMMSMENDWNRIYGDLVYHTQGGGSANTPDDVKSKLKDIMRKLEDFFDKETSTNGRGTLPQMVKELRKLK